MVFIIQFKTKTNCYSEHKSYFVSSVCPLCVSLSDSETLWIHWTPTLIAKEFMEISWHLSQSRRMQHSGIFFVKGGKLWSIPHSSCAKRWVYVIPSFHTFILSLNFSSTIPNTYWCNPAPYAALTLIFLTCVLILSYDILLTYITRYVNLKKMRVAKHLACCSCKCVQSVSAC